jgi:hypothetical protein
MLLDVLRNTGLVSKDADNKQAIIEVIVFIEFLLLLLPVFILSPYPFPWGFGLGRGIDELRPIFLKTLAVATPAIVLPTAKMIIQVRNFKKRGLVPHNRYLLDKKIIGFNFLSLVIQVYFLLDFFVFNR